MCNVRDRLGHPHEVNAEIEETEIELLKCQESDID